MKRYSLIILVFALAAAITLSGCQGRTEPAKVEPKKTKLKVAASVYPVYDFATEVGGDKIDLSMIVPPGTLPHDFEPTPKELLGIKSADIFLYHGANFEPWIAKLVTKDILGNAKPVEISKNIPSLKESGENNYNRRYHEPKRSANSKEKTPIHIAHTESDVDPHVWLDPVRAMEQVKNIAAAFGAHDPDNAVYYQDNAAKFNSQIAKLHEEFLSAAARAQGKELVVNHAAFGYLADRYKLKQVAIMGLAPDAEPTPETIASVIDLCREHRIKYIFAEKNADNKLSETIAQETGAKILVLNTIETLTKEDIAQNKNYLSIMRENLAAIEQAFRQ